VAWAAAPVKEVGVEAVVTVPLLEAVMSVPVPAREVTTAEEVVDGVMAAVEYPAGVEEATRVEATTLDEAGTAEVAEAMLMVIETPAEAQVPSTAVMTSAHCRLAYGLE
jgi:hypothetical protein